jgi:DNA polymerase-3 subunit alpha
MGDSDRNGKNEILKITDKTGSMEAVAFPKIYEKYKDVLIADQCIAVKGKISERNGSMSILAEIIKKVV